MCAARDCRTMLLSIDGDQYEAPESAAHVVASSLPALHVLVCASNSEPCQPCVLHNLPCPRSRYLRDILSLSLVSFTHPYPLLSISA
jgi:hypothetical protein